LSRERAGVKLELVAEGTPPRPGPPRVEDLSAFLVHLEYDGRPTLVVLLARDGSINRMGDGTLDPEVDSTWYIGRVEEPLFDKLMEVVPEEILELSGRYDPPDRLGVECKCTFVFSYKDGQDIGLEIVWGSESAGLPLEMQRMIARAVELTDPWWRAQPNEPNLRYFGKT
jgi:hypothetical protein